ncbi:uncharacterized mitochondrial protein AtMg00810-like [Juglans microcarpa x Juglans regia]|uniref:uncharacterized mitochondrial protein AtMg00810-like n=1 Tax=Juglans microcarpa x Juglans regia TaxID=2249226 RepID=UPI001B7E471C|nr:uncharacterized mitochondrial protein AtMg00810-like [Juglans microcarpa x Juglans regia]
MVDLSLFINHSSDGTLIPLLYVDDMALIGDTPSRIDWLVSQLSAEFSIKDMGSLHQFLGIQVHRTHQSLFLSQIHYALDLLQRASMDCCKPCAIPMPSKGRIVTSVDKQYLDPTHYRSLVGRLQ